MGGEGETEVSVCTVDQPLGRNTQQHTLTRAPDTHGSLLRLMSSVNISRQHGSLCDARVCARVSACRLAARSSTDTFPLFIFQTAQPRRQGDHVSNLPPDPCPSQCHLTAGNVGVDACIMTIVLSARCASHMCW